MVLNHHKLFARCDLVELRCCALLNRSSEYSLIKALFVVISRLGDGILWYALTATLPVLYGINGCWMSLQILMICFLCLIIYKSLKRSLVRERPCLSFDSIKSGTPALDRYSFPSGHTMHAVAFTMMLSAYLPRITLMMWAFTVLIAFSRVILGLHYPSDVIAGALFGYLVGCAGLALGSYLQLVSF